MKAIIFNSGLGNRMRELTRNGHKSMVRLANGETIFERQLRILSECGIRDFVVTTGPFEEQLKEAASQPRFAHLKIQFVRNPIYDKTNYIYSMYLAREYFDDDALMLHGDLVFDKAFVKAVLADKEPCLGAVNKKKELPEKDFKARLTGDRITEVSIHIFDENCFAFQPFYKLDYATLRAWVKKVEEFIEAGDDKVYAENALNQIAADLDIRAFGYEEYYVEEVDTPEDLEKVSADIRLFDFREQDITKGIGALQELPRILEETGAKKPMLVCDSSYPFLPADAYFKKIGFKPVVFDGFTPNPLYEDVIKGVRLFRDEQCDLIVSLGGGSTIDTAKNIKLFSVLDEKENYLRQEFKYSSVKHIAIPTTAGTGSESTRFSVLYFEGEKQSIAHDCIVPEYVILDGEMLTTLPDYQKKCTALDAFCQCIESLWSANSTPDSQKIALAGLDKLLGMLGVYLQGDKNAAQEIMKAANLSGQAINITQTTAAHAMSYKLTSLYRIPHGHAAALCLPFIIRYMDKNKGQCSDPRGKEYLERVLQIIYGRLGVQNGEQACEKIIGMMKEMDMPFPELKDQGDLETLTNSVNPVRMKNNPILLTKEVIREIYKNVFSIK